MCWPHEAAMGSCGADVRFAVGDKEEEEKEGGEEVKKEERAEERDVLTLHSSISHFIHTHTHTHRDATSFNPPQNTNGSPAVIFIYSFNQHSPLLPIHRAQIWVLAVSQTDEGPVLGGPHVLED